MNIFLFSFLLLIFSASRTLASVAGDVNRANHLYEQGQFDDALDLYQKALGQDDKSMVVKYDLGTDFYKKGDYPKALEYLRQVSREKNAKIRLKAQYNLGNALYRSGVQAENKDLPQAIKTLQDALGQYEQVVQEDAKDQDAAFNEDVVKREIERLKHQNQQKQQNQQNQKNQQQNNQRRQNKQQSQQNQQNQQNQAQHQNQNQPEKQPDQSSQPKSQPQQGSQAQQSQAPQHQQAQVQQSPQELDRKEAEEMLEDYRQNDEPKKLLNYMPQKIDTRPVSKDW